MPTLRTYDPIWDRPQPLGPQRGQVPTETSLRERLYDTPTTTHFEDITCERCDGDGVVLHGRACPICDGVGSARSWVDVELHTETTCPDCHGGGELGYEPLDWWHGSGVNVRLWACRRCDGTGTIDLYSFSERQRALEAALDVAYRLEYAEEREAAADKWRAFFPEIRYTDDVPF